MDKLVKEVVRLDKQGKNSVNSFEYLSKIMDGLEQLIQWYNWQNTTEKGIIFQNENNAWDSEEEQSMFQQLVQKEDVIDIQKLKQEKLEWVFAIGMELVKNKYEDLLAFQGPLKDQFDIFDMPDLFHVQEQGKNYLCFGGLQHAKIQHFYQKHLEDEKNGELELQTAVESSQLKEQELVFTDFIFFFIKQEEIKVIILDQMDINEDQDQIQILFLKTQTPTPELTIETYVKREWSFHLNKDEKNIQAVEGKEEIKKLNEIFDQCKLQNIDHCEWFKMGKKKYVFTCEANNQKKQYRNLSGT
ncbi:UNKNOWN [Stylonychia lemnae]|uniref:Uncharacterized protein n=1 Tax=Stylonychia lemnae TaxID=5949 RepID=A0A077ZPI0_STYLE|nr:UNKNOWN [Stylonychia lemnae]|eukprot:CDW71882.1 UNKNOWN [Stylonychia lemnae]